MMMVGGGGGGGAGDGDHLSGRMQSLHPNPERLPQWSQQETRDLIAARADLERDFNVSKRNKTLWEAVAAKMRERGYRRSPEQCKCKWKNLVNRYKGKETADPDTGRQCPFFDELHAVFTERARNMQRLLLLEADSGTAQSKKKLKRLPGERSSEELSSDNDDDEEESDEEPPTTKVKKKKLEKRKSKPDSSSNSSSIHDVLQEFLQQQQKMELRWQETVERRARERWAFEEEWRRSMEKMERERMVLEQAWREREEQRRAREESRAEKRDELLRMILNKLIQDDL